MNDITQIPDDHLLKLAQPDMSHLSDEQLVGMMQPQQSAQPISMGGRFMQGVVDPMNALAQLGLHAMGGEGLGEMNPATSLDQNIARDEQNYQARRQASGNTGIDFARMGGNIAATAPLAMGAPAFEGGLMADVANGIGQGALSATTQPVTNDKESFGDQKINQLELGSGLGAGGGVLGNALSKFISPKVSSDVQTLLNEGVTPTPGQILGGGYKWTEDKLTSIPLLGNAIKSGQTRAINEMNTAALGRALSPISQNAPSQIGREGIESVKNSLSDAYNTVLPKLNFTADPQFTGQLNQLRGLAQNLPEQQAKQFNKIIDTQINGKLSQTGMMDGISYKGAQSELQQAAKGYASDSSYDNRQLGAALMQANSLMKDQLKKSNPQYAQELSSIDNGYANYAVLRNAASRLGTNGQEELGAFTPSQLQSAVRAQDKSAGKGSFATGNARMQDLSDAAVKVLGNKYPDSGTAGREMLGVMLGSALEGGSALTGHAVLPLAAGGITSLAYTPTGQKLAAALLTKRPDLAEPLALALKQSAPMLTNAGAVFGSQAAAQ